MINFENIKSATDVKKIISDTRFRYVNYKMGHRYDKIIRFLFDDKIHPLFNKAIIFNDDMIELSWDYYCDVSKYLVNFIGKLKNYEFRDKRLVDKEYNKIVKNCMDRGIIPKKPLYAKSTTKPSLYQITDEQIADVISSLFSAEYLQNNFGSSWNMDTVRMKHLNEPYVMKEGWKSPVIRMKEDYEDYTVALSLSVDDNTMKINLHTHKGIRFYDNPISSFYLNYYNSYRIHKEVDVNLLSFLEYLGYENYPDNRLNIESFNIMFNVFSAQTDMGKKFRDSGRKQMKFLNLLFPYLIIFGGTDAHGKHLINSKSEILQYDDVHPGLRLKLYNVSRLFSTPFHDVVLICGVDKPAYNTNEVEVLCNANLTIYPYDPDRPFTGKAWQHQIIYNASK